MEPIRKNPCFLIKDFMWLQRSWQIANRTLIPLWRGKMNLSFKIHLRMLGRRYKNAVNSNAAQWAKEVLGDWRILSAPMHYESWENDSRSKRWQRMSIGSFLSHPIKNQTPLWNNSKLLLNILWNKILNANWQFSQSLPLPLKQHRQTTNSQKQCCPYDIISKIGAGMLVKQLSGKEACKTQLKEESWQPAEQLDTHWSLHLLVIL